jgi:hypothetical protein
MMHLKTFNSFAKFGEFKLKTFGLKKNEKFRKNRFIKKNDFDIFQKRGRSKLEDLKGSLKVSTKSVKPFGQDRANKHTNKQTKKNKKT